MSNLNNIEDQSPDIPHEAMVSRYEAIKIVHNEKGSFIAETCHFVSENEPLPFYVNENTLPHLNFRPLLRAERRHIHEYKDKHANTHAKQMMEVLERFSELEMLEEIVHDLAKGKVLA